MIFYITRKTVKDLICCKYLRKTNTLHKTFVTSFFSKAVKFSLWPHPKSRKFQRSFGVTIYHSAAWPCSEATNQD